MNPVITISEMEYYYGKKEAAPRSVLTGINLSVEKGELLALIGASGSGKTTLLQIIAGLLLPKTGQVNVLGLDLGDPELQEKDLDKHRRRVAIALQRPEEMLFRTYVGDDIAYGPANYGLKGQALALRVKEAMDAIGLPYALFKDRRTDSLSGGEMRKAALAGVLALKPEILLLDEPAAGLDPAATRELFRRIRDLRAAGTSVIFSTHDMEQVMLADRAAVCSEGRLIAVQPPQELFFLEELPENSGLLAPEAARIYRHLKSMGIDTGSKKELPVDPESLAEGIAAAFFKGAAS